MTVSKLDLKWTTREGGGGKTQRRYLDVVIDDVPLSERLDADFISPFGWFDLADQSASVERLLRKRPPDLSDDRVSLYVCPECGDLGCGAVTVKITGTPGGIVWAEFGIQNNYDAFVHREGLEGVGPFEFDGRMYHRVFGRVLQSI
jgi:hypothetical protein